jgi:hypothetical protein
MHRALLLIVILMAWCFPFRRAVASPVEARQEPKVEFLAEKTGPTEDELKASLVAVFRKYPDVQRAYLAIISTDDKKTWSVALCLAPKKEDQKLVGEVSELFHKMFGQGQYLDMLFLTEVAEGECQHVCPAFYRREEA